MPRESRLWIRAFYRKPYEFLAEQAARQGDRLWFQEPRTRWLVLHHPEDVKHLLSLPADVVEGSFVKQSLAPWITDRVLPGMQTGRHGCERKRWFVELSEFHKIDLQDCIDNAIERLPRPTRLGHVDLSAWCQHTAMAIAARLLGDADLPCFTASALRQLTAPVGAILPRRSRWGTLALIRAVYTRFSNASSIFDPPFQDYDYQRRFLMYAGLVANLTAMMRHLFAETLRAPPEVVSRLRAEAAAADVHQRVRYSHAVCNESLRRSPNLVFIVREAMQDFSLRGLPVERGTIVAACPHLTHHRPDTFDAPRAFRPDRFYDQPPVSVDSFYPFGLGARSCPIKWFSRDIVARVLTSLVAKHNLELVDQRPNPVTFAKILLSTTRARRDRVVVRPVARPPRGVNAPAIERAALLAEQGA